MNRFSTSILALCGAAATVFPAAAAEVRTDISSRETVPNLPVVMQIAVQYQDRVTPPAFPEIPNVEVRSSAGVTGSSTTIINGRMSRTNTVTYQYEFIPRAEGEFTIPSVAVEADGQVFHTEAMLIAVTKSDTEDLLFVEVKSDRDAIYLGEPLEVTLSIWLRPFRANNNSLDVQDMWGTIERDSSSWGVFADKLEQRGSVSARKELRRDAQNVRRAYFVYEIKKQIWPEKAGLLDPGEIRIVVQYPTRVGASRDPFDSFFSDRRVRVLRARPIAAAAEVQPVQVKPIPIEGRPAGYTGAVGRHRFEVSAKPTEVAVGDPITLSMVIQGEGRLEVLQGPDLAAVPGLSDNFSLPSDPMAGVVEGRRKRFTQSIRPRRESVTEIPPIPFPYFDPKTERFETVYSDPIPITVRPASKLAASEIVDATGGGPVTTALREQSHGILANYADVNDLLASHAFTPGWGAGAAIGVPPVLFALLSILRLRSERLRVDRGYARRRGARRRALAAIQGVRHDSHEGAGILSAAVAGYIADRCNLPSGGLTRSEAVQHLRQRQLPAGLLERVDALLAECEDAQYSGAHRISANGLADRARGCIEALEKEKL